MSSTPACMPDHGRMEFPSNPRPGRLGRSQPSVRPPISAALTKASKSLFGTRSDGILSSP
ncbi:hypothetical protein ACFFX0_16585 [Citricoccus parietis]|uniref:Uncharacterized protein n=1 Tax=Citricoccus parietis TaxID=592307 RepID=A0ABV5G1A9_9MICC